jgi:hypothetical protein
LRSFANFMLEGRPAHDVVDCSLISATVDTEGNDRCLATCRRNVSVMN